jgi:microcystin-dependent protein
MADRVLNFVPVGAIQAWPTDTAPTGWVLCRGQQISRSTYQGLFNLISTTYGAGNGTTTFNVPDLQQRFPLGKATSGTGSSLAGTGGTIDHTHTSGSITGSTSSDGAHTHSVSGTTGSESSHTHGLSALTSAATATPAGADINYQAGGSTLNFTVGGHAHFTSASTQTSDAGSSHSHGAGSLGSDSNGAHTHGAGSLTMAATGTANPPFLTLNYIIFTGVA